MSDVVSTSSTDEGRSTDEARSTDQGDVVSTSSTGEVGGGKRLLRPYGDTTGDGMVQLSFTLPMPHSKIAEGSAVQLANKMGMDPALVAHAKPMGPDFTFFVVYGRVNHLVDPSVVEVVERDYELLTPKEVNATIKSSLPHWAPGPPVRRRTRTCPSPLSTPPARPRGCWPTRRSSRPQPGSSWPPPSSPTTRPSNASTTRPGAPVSARFRSPSQWSRPAGTRSPGPRVSTYATRRRVSGWCGRGLVRTRG